ncbi:hypothetical protein ERJ75_000979100 [Trypanosoma vivax]|nr:hypothetical protein ERJ75_000979100 [Trypanosoma vivax]
MRLAPVAASRWDEVALLQKENFIERPCDRNSLTFGWGALRKTSKADPNRAARWMAIAGADVVMVRKAAAKMAGERLETLGARAAERILQPHSAAALSIKRGALEPPRSVVRHLGRWTSILNSSVKFAAFM